MTRENEIQTHEKQTREKHGTSKFPPGPGQGNNSLADGLGMGLDLSEEESLPNGITLRHLRSVEDFEGCLELQQETWGTDFEELVPPTILRIGQKVSGVVAGAFDSEGRQLGFVYGLTGIRKGRIAHWSHMLAVTAEAKGLGLGKALKIFQRNQLRSLGVAVMYWTYDPLIARNANLNLNRLGALPEEYVRNMYGESTGSELHSGLGTDRFVVAWELEANQVEEHLAAPETLGVLDNLPPLDRIVNVDESGQPLGHCLTGLSGVGDTAAPTSSLARGLWVEIPEDIDGLKSRDQVTALKWRDSVRASFEHYLPSHRVGALRRVPQPGAHRYFYELERQASS